MSTMSTEAQAFEQRKVQRLLEESGSRNRKAMRKAKRLILDQGYDWDTAITMAAKQHAATPEIVWYLLKADQSPRNEVTGKVEKAW